MNLNTKVYSRFPELDRGIIYLYMIARFKNFPRYYFPDEYKELENISLSSAFGVTIPKEWMQRWISKWPTQSITMLDYGVSGNTAACTKRMKKFVKDFNAVMGTDYEVEKILDVIDEATDKYLQRQEDKYWDMTKKNAKFISDLNGSVLETFCREIVDR